MVKGLDIFRAYFKDYANNYILIGGAACDEQMSEAGLTFRATKDLDIILIVEALNAEFVTAFWKFVTSGKYRNKLKSVGKREYYRFLKPENEEYPAQLELFARNPDLLDLEKETKLTPIPIDEDLSSLSAILMNDDYYSFTLKNSKVENDLHLAKIEALICLKAKAFLDLKKRKKDGENIDSGNIKKHKNDVIRLASILTENNSLNLPNSIYADMKEFMKAIESEPPDFRAIGKSVGIPANNGERIIEQLKLTFSI